MDNTNNVLYMGKLDYSSSSALGTEHDISYSERAIDSYCWGTTTASEICTIWDNWWITDTLSGTSTTFHYYAGQRRRSFDTTYTYNIGFIMTGTEARRHSY